MRHAIACALLLAVPAGCSRTIGLEVPLDAGGGDLAQVPRALSFAPVKLFDGQGIVGPVALADMDGDKRLDVVTNSGYVLLGDGAGGLGAASGGQAAGFRVRVADWNGDGRPDVALASGINQSVTLLYNDGFAGGKFAATSAVVATGYSFQTVAAADWNGDGRTDLALALYAQGVNGEIGTGLELNGGGGGFGPITTQPAGAFVGDVASADFDRDGRADLAALNYQGNSVTVLLGKGDGTFGAPTAVPLIGAGENSLCIADLNGDGKLDLAVAGVVAGKVAVALGKGDGTFAPSVGWDCPGAYAVVAADFDGDGHADLAVADLSGNRVNLLLGAGDGTFGAPRPFAGFEMPHGLAAGDLNGDGKPDLVLDSGNSQAAVLLNTST